MCQLYSFEDLDIKIVNSFEIIKCPTGGACFKKLKKRKTLKENYNHKFFLFVRQNLL